VVSTILIVDDSEVSRSSIRRALEYAGLEVQVLEASDGAEALPVALSGRVDIVVSDVVMPKLDGIELLRAIRAQRDAESLPVILVTSLGDGDTRSQSFEAGASDYINKPFSPAELVNRVQVQLRLLRLQEELRRSSERYRVLGSHDELTGLANRRHFFELARREMARSRRHRFSMSVAIADIDSFREVNTRVGYLVGDAIITEIGMVLGKHLRTTDVLSRLGGEKFAALLPQTDTSDARAVSDRMVQAVHAHAFPNHATGGLTLSVGAATYPSGGLESVDELVNAAEASLDRAKSQGGGVAELWVGSPDALGRGRATAREAGAIMRGGGDDAVDESNATEAGEGDPPDDDAAAVDEKTAR